MTISLTYSSAANRIADVLRAIMASEEWRCYSSALPRSDWADGREPFRRFFDAYEETEGTDWLGVMEWAVLEQMKATGSDLTVSRETVDEVIARMGRHPDIRLTR
jgi:hypothetical protein